MASSAAPTDPELLESLRLLHQRLSRIEEFHASQLAWPSIPTNYNPFSGASKSELERLAALEAYRVTDEQIRNDHARALVLHDALFQAVNEKIKQLQARVGMIPTAPPSVPPQYAPPSAPQYQPPPQYQPAPQYQPPPQPPPAPPQAYPEPSSTPEAQARFRSRA